MYIQDVNKFNNAKKEYTEIREEYGDQFWRIVLPNTSRLYKYHGGWLSFPEHMSWQPVLVWVHVTRSLVLCVCFVDRFCPFSFGQCPSSIYEFWFTLWYPQALLIRGRNCLPFASTWLHHRLNGGVRVALYKFLCCVLFVFVQCLISQCCQCLWIVHSWLPPWFSLTFIDCYWKILRVWEWRKTI